jgi:four helix bundle protein
MTKEGRSSNPECRRGKHVPESENAPRVSANGRSEKVFDLEERTAVFGETVIRFCKTIPLSVITEPLIKQMVRSSTSVGANCCEADDAVSGKEFRQKIGTCKKESRETKHWLRMMAAAEPGHAAQARVLWREANELHLIFASIFRKLSSKKPKPK